MKRRSIPLLVCCSGLVTGVLQAQVVRVAATPWWDAWPARSAGALVLVLAFWAAHRLRLRHVACQMNRRFEERLRERTRVAGELHDSLLQGLLSASMQLDIAADRLPADSPVKPQLTHILELMTRVSSEGRKALQGLRGTDGTSMRLEEAFAEMQHECARQELRVAVEGRPRLLQPLLRDEIYRIGREAVNNAFRHSDAKIIRVEIEYTGRAFRLEVRDDGCGIDRHIIRGADAGGGGLQCMREHSEKIGAQFHIWSRAGRGTKVELLVPGSIAFGARPCRENPPVTTEPWATGFYRW